MDASLQFSAVRRRDPVEVVTEVYDRIRPGPVWTLVRDRAEVLAEAADLARRWPDPAGRPPLYGIPYSVKDNIDVAGLPTTAACPDFAYLPQRSAVLVDRLRAAGAICVGKNNLDQFATGLTGTRSPYGVCTSPFDPRYISGGSSSGSAVAVATGEVSFAIGTDTAGSGRVPAALCNIVGLKPTPGLVSTLGIVPACPSLDCPSVFALSVPDAAAVLAVIAGPEPADPWSIDLPAWPEPFTRPVRIGVPREREFGGDSAFAAAYADGLARLAALGATLVPVDLGPFLAAGRLLYGPWVAERWAHLADFVTTHPGSVHPVTRQVLESAAGYSAADAFRAVHRLRELRAATAPVWRDVAALAVPTVPTTFTVEQIAADPLRRNAFLGYYTHFANLLDLAAVAVPSGFTPAGLPVGLSFLAPAGRDGALAALAADYQASARLPVGATGQPLEPVDPQPTVAPPQAPADLEAAESEAADSKPTAAPPTVLAVVGAHRSGQPLHAELETRGAQLIGPAWTAPCYRLFTLADAIGQVARPGLIRVEAGGAPVEVELHEVTPAVLGELLVGIPAPLGLGTVELSDGRRVVGFLAESYAVVGQRDITEYGSWPAYLGQLMA